MSQNRVNRFRFIFTLAACVFVPLALMASASADSPSYLNEMPSAQKVMDTVHGKDDVDTAARQWGVFDRLISMMGLMRPQEFAPLTSDENRIRQSYIAEENRIVASVQSRLLKKEASGTATNTSWERWNKLRYTYSENDLPYVLKKFFSTQWQSQYLDAAQSQKQFLAMDLQNRQSKNNYPWMNGITRHSTTFIFVLLAIIIIVARILAPKYRTLLSRHGLLYLIEIIGGWLLGALTPFTVIFLFVNVFLGISLMVGGIVGSAVLITLAKRHRNIIQESYGNYDMDQDARNEISGIQSYKQADASPQRAKCSACGGSGSQSCPSSMCRNGYQYMGGESSFSELCPTCLGKGEINCSRCGGTGYG